LHLVKGRNKPELERKMPVKLYLKTENINKLDDISSDKKISRSSIVDDILTSEFQKSKQTE